MSFFASCPLSPQVCKRWKVHWRIIVSFQKQTKPGISAQFWQQGTGMQPILSGNTSQAPKNYEKIMPSSRRWCQTPISNKHRWRSADERFKRICRVILKRDQSVAILNKSRTYGNCNLRHLMWKVSWLKNAALNKSHGLWSPNGQEPGFKVTNAHILTRLTHSSQRYCLLWTKSSRIEVNIRKIFSQVWHTSNYW